jgi:hypothetical protein
VHARAQYWSFTIEPSRPWAQTDEGLVSEPSSPAERSSPQDGDVVITREAHSRVHYTVRQLPGIVQFSAAVRDEAVRLARTFGQRHRIDVWYSEDGTYRLLEAYRPRTSPRTSVRQAAGVITPT